MIYRNRTVAKMILLYHRLAQMCERDDINESNRAYYLRRNAEELSKIMPKHLQKLLGINLEKLAEENDTFLLNECADALTKFVRQ